MRKGRTLKGNVSSDGKTRVFSVRLQMEFAEMLEILAGLSDQSVAKQLNMLLGLGFRSYDTVSPTMALQMKSIYLQREVDRVARAVTESKKKDATRVVEDDLALRRRLQADIDKNRYLLSQAMEDKKLRQQVENLPGHSRTIAKGEEG